MSGQSDPAAWERLANTERPPAAALPSASDETPSTPADRLYADAAAFPANRLTLALLALLRGATLVLGGIELPSAAGGGMALVAVLACLSAITFTRAGRRLARPNGREPFDAATLASEHCRRRSRLVHPGRPHPARGAGRQRVLGRAVYGHQRSDHRCGGPPGLDRGVGSRRPGRRLPAGRAVPFSWAARIRPGECGGRMGECHVVPRLLHCRAYGVPAVAQHHRAGGDAPADDRLAVRRAQQIRGRRPYLADRP